jgi:hypothetical protein
MKHLCETVQKRTVSHSENSLTLEAKESTVAKMIL